MRETGEHAPALGRLPSAPKLHWIECGPSHLVIQAQLRLALSKLFFNLIDFTVYFAYCGAALEEQGTFFK